MKTEPRRALRCDCFLCRRHRRLDYVERVLRRVGDEPAAEWLDVMFNHLLDVEDELEGWRRRTADEPPVNPLAARIEERRLALGLTKSQAAQRAGVSRGTWHEMETGRRAPDRFLLLRFDEALELPPGTLHG